MQHAKNICACILGHLSLSFSLPLPLFSLRPPPLAPTHPPTCFHSPSPKTFTHVRLHTHSLSPATQSKESHSRRITLPKNPAHGFRLHTHKFSGGQGTQGAEPSQHRCIHGCVPAKRRRGHDFCLYCHGILFARRPCATFETDPFQEHRGWVCFEFLP